MNTTKAAIEQTVVDFLVRIEKLPVGFQVDTPLYANGAELDSLETAELSATLEDVHGTDPFAAVDMPQTLNDILNFYGSV